MPAPSGVVSELYERPNVQSKVISEPIVVSRSLFFYFQGIRELLSPKDPVNI